jgi:putative aldouronate transport system permease protein
MQTQTQMQTRTRTNAKNGKRAGGAPAGRLPGQKGRLGDAAFYLVACAVFSAFTLLCVFPFYYIFINTISANDLASKGLVVWYPRQVHFDNYLEVLSIRNLGRAALVSLSRTVIGTALSVACTSFVAYALSKKELWKRKLWYRFFIVTMYFNPGIIPWYINMQNLRLTDNFLAYVIGVVNPFNLILVKTYIESMPASLEESAEIDGAGYMRLFARIVFPLCKPIVATVAVFTAVLQWNSFMDTLLLMKDTRLYTLQFLLWQYLNEANAIAAMLRSAGGQGSMAYVNPARFLTTTSVKMTISMIVVIPILFVYPMFQRYFVKGIMIGAVKG